ncbi:MAG: hypothetical protein K9W44_03580 [Candidatus Lokiarchaeota archaeon]|nr:hypothetical protein [Candidatus Harpocratesius repetitus]
MQIPSLSELLPQIDLTYRLESLHNQLFILGRNPELSLAEICALYHSISISPKFIDVSTDGAIVNAPNHIDIQKSGAILKQCEIIGQIGYQISEESIKKILLEHFEAEYIEDKSFWAISVYNRNRSSMSSEEFTHFSELIHTTVKSCLKKLKIRKTQRIHEYQKDFLSPRKLKRKEVIERGFELILWFQPNQIIIAQTRKVINIDDFAHRDSDRPFTRPLLLLGLALARSMINLISIQENNHKKSVYDPFCGMGTIPAEAYLLGIEAYGSDIDSECVVQARQNLKWLSRQKKYRKQRKPYHLDNIFQMDITKPELNKFPWITAESKEKDKIVGKKPQYNGAIVAETNLLTPRKSYPSRSEALQMLHEFEHNYTQYFQGLMSILPVNGIGVLVFPQIHMNDDKILQFPVKRFLSEFNCKILSFQINNIEIPAIFVHNWKKPIIERLIVVFQKKS